MTTTLRAFQPTDLSQIISVAMKAYPLDPQWVYRYPQQHLYQDAAEAFIRARFETTMKDIATGAVTIMVVDAEPGAPEGRVVGFSLWRNPGWHLKKGEEKTNPVVAPPQQTPEGASPERMAAFRDALGASTKELMEGVYGDEQLQLGLLYVLPEFQGKGLGRMMATWGLERGRKEGVPVTLFASPMGRRLYERLGFRVVGLLKVRVEGEDESIEYPGMVWKAEENPV